MCDTAEFQPIFSTVSIWRVSAIRLYDFLTKFTERTKMIDLTNTADNVCDIWEDVTSNQTSRTGHSAARVASSLANGVDPEVLALQVTKNSKKNDPDNADVFSANDILAVDKWHKANKKRSAYPKRQAGALIRGQRIDDGNNLNPSIA